MSDYNRTQINKFDYFPVFIDYSFAESKPRGGSAFIEFFAAGQLCSLMDELGSASDITFVSKGNIKPEKGFFLVDFDKAVQQPEAFIAAVKKLNLKHIYVEDSVNHSIRSIFEEIPELTVSYVAFRA